MIRFVNVDHDTQTFTASIWVTYVYADPRLAWNRDKVDDQGNLIEKDYYPGEIKVEPGAIWLPDLALYNSAGDSLGLYDDMIHTKSDALAQVFHNGSFMVYAGHGFCLLRFRS